MFKTLVEYGQTRPHLFSLYTLLRAPQKDFYWKSRNSGLPASVKCQACFIQLYETRRTKHFISTLFAHWSWGLAAG